MSYTYGDLTFISDHVVIDDTVYRDVPDGFTTERRDYGARVDNVKTLGVSRVAVIQAPINLEVWHTATANELFNNYKQVTDNALLLTWQKSYMSLTMADHLKTLYTINKSFYLQFDDEMSYDLMPVTSESPINQNGVTLFPEDNNYQYYLTPTAPVACYRNASSDGVVQWEYQYIKLFKNGEPCVWEDNPWRLDVTTGLLRFEISNEPTDVIAIQYVWRMYGHIVKLEIMPESQNARAQDNYVGNIVFEQLPLPPTILEPIYVEEPPVVVGDFRGIDSDFDHTILASVNEYIGSLAPLIPASPDATSLYLTLDNMQVISSVFSDIEAYYELETGPLNIPLNCVVIAIWVNVFTGELACNDSTIAAIVSFIPTSVGGTPNTLSKSSQNNYYQNHAAIGDIDSTSNVLFGSTSEQFNQPIITYPALQFAEGMTFTAELLGATDSPKFDLAIASTGSYLETYKNVAGVWEAPYTDSWGSVSATQVSPWVYLWTYTGIATNNNGLFNTAEVSITNGLLELQATYMGSGQSPTQLTALLTGYIKATVQGADQVTKSASVRRLNTPTTNMINSGNEKGIEILIDETVTIPIVNGSGYYDIFFNALIQGVINNLGSNMVATVQVYLQAQFMEQSFIDNFGVQVYYRQPTDTGGLFYTAPSNNGGIAPFSTGEGGTQALWIGAGTVDYLFQGFDISSIPTGSTITGFEATFEALETYAGNLYLQIGLNGTGGATSSLKTIPLTAVKESFVEGGALDVWGLSETLTISDLIDLTVIVTSDALGASVNLGIINFQLAVSYIEPLY